MVRGKIEIKRIENSTNRQVTYSKRRKGLFKKANELAILCDAKVSIIMHSNTGKLHEYISPSTTTKQLFDEYQKTLKIDLWSSHYEIMQENLRKLKEVNNKLRHEIRQRMGQNLDDLNFEELRGLEQDMDSSLKIIRDRKYRGITNQIETYKKKARNAEQIHRGLLHKFVSMDARDEGSHFGLIDDGGDYHSVLGYQNGGTGVFGLRLQPNQPNLHSGARSDLAHDLRLA
uniref:AP31 n=1 Tax=Cercidiphyllum japonicum TaxID=13413 RepID=A0A2H4L6J4_CERJA|nr:AP31 [Cercidiphyllum japonicum]